MSVPWKEGLDEMEDGNEE